MIEWNCSTCHVLLAYSWRSEEVRLFCSEKCANEYTESPIHEDFYKPVDYEGVKKDQELIKND